MTLLKSLLFCTILAIAYSQNCNNVEVAELVLDEEDNRLVATWSVSGNAEGCDSEYQVTYSSNVDSGRQETFTTSDTTITLDVVPCSTVTIAVARIGGTETVSLSKTIDTNVAQAPVLRDMITSCNSIQMIWESQPYNENMCEVTHFQMFCLSDTHNFTIPQGVTDVTHRTFDVTINVLRPDIYYTCNGYIFVTLAGFSPPSANIEFWSNLDMVRDLELEDVEGSLRASWIAPLNSEECGVAYDVTYENEVLGSETIEVVGTSHEFDIELLPCTDYTITVTPISFTGSKGTAVSKDMTPVVRVRDVSDLTISDNDSILALFWSAVPVGTCAVSYEVQYLVNAEVQASFTTTDTTIFFDRITCATSTFSVQVVSEGVTSGDVRGSIILDTEDITSISEVSNVRLVDDLILWDPPVTVGLCSISYIVNIQNMFGEEVVAVADTSVGVDLIPCSLNRVTVTGVYGQIEGTPTTYEIGAPSEEFSAPTHVRTDPGFTTASITLRADTNAQNLCVLTAAQVECSNDDGDSFARDIAVADDESRLFTIEVDNLQQDTIYTCAAKWQDSSATTEFSFRTIPLSVKTLEVTEINEGGFLVSWTEDYGEAFVNSYTLVIESLGPLHAVEDRCDIERNAVYTFEHTNAARRQVFVDGFPNYDYRIYLSTDYSLGFSLNSYVLPANTLTAAPGSLDNLRVGWLQAEGEAYDVSAVLAWNAPCDLNGDLRSFNVKVVASFLLNSIEQSVTIYDSVSADSDIISSIYDYAITDINPFFTYEVHVSTVAASEGPATIVTLSPPGVCACESS